MQLAQSQISRGNQSILTYNGKGMIVNYLQLLNLINTKLKKINITHLKGNL